MSGKKKSIFSSVLSYTLIFTLLISNIMETKSMSWAQENDDFYSEIEAVEYIAEESYPDASEPETVVSQEATKISEPISEQISIEESDDFLEDGQLEKVLEQMPEIPEKVPVESTVDSAENTVGNNQIEVSAKSPEMTLVYKDEKTHLHIQAEVPEGAFETANPVKLDVTDLKKEEFDLLRTLVYKMDLELEDMPLYTARIRFLGGEKELKPAKPVELHIYLPEINWSQEGFLLFRCEEKEGKVDKESIVKAIKEEKELKKEKEFTSDWKERVSLEKKGEKLNQITLLMKEGGVFSFYRKAEKPAEIEETEAQTIENETEFITEEEIIEETTDSEMETEVETSNLEEKTEEETEEETSEDETAIEEETESETSEEDTTIKEETEGETSEEETVIEEETEGETSEEETTIEEETEGETSEEETTIEEETEEETTEETSEVSTEDVLCTILTYEDAETGLRIEAEIPEGTFETENPVELKVSALNSEDLEQIRLFVEQNLMNLEEIPCFAAKIYFTDGEQEVIPANPIDIRIWPADTEWSETGFAIYRYEPEAEVTILTEIQKREEQDAGTEWKESVLLEENEEKLSQITLSVKAGGSFVLYRKEAKEEVAEETELIRTFFWENEDVSITISGTLEAFPETMDHVSVTPVLAENEETAVQYEEVSEHLQNKAEEEEYSIAGFLAYDISLRDMDDNQLEPNAPISVSIEYHNAVIPEEVQNAINDLPVDEEYNVDVTVMHLKEDEEGAVETVENLADEDNNGQITNLEVNDANEIEKAEFTSDSFSIYTITWNVGQKQNFKFQENKRYIFYIEQDGKYYALGYDPINDKAQTIELKDTMIPRTDGLQTMVEATSANSAYIWMFTSSDGTSGNFHAANGQRLTLWNMNKEFVQNISYNNYITYTSNRKLRREDKGGNSGQEYSYVTFNSTNNQFTNTYNTAYDWNAAPEIKIAEISFSDVNARSVQTVDSRADGIKLNLFDYYGDNLDSWNNHYKSQINNGINSGHALKFFGYGTQLKTDTGTSNANTYDMNVSGNAWKNDGSNNSARAVQGIVDNVLSGGYPKLANGGESLNYLFDPNVAANGKTSYTDANHLFVSTGPSSYYFNSNEYYAQYLDGDFQLTQYQYDNGKWGSYSIETNLQTEKTTKVGFFPFNAPNPNQTSVKPEGDKYYNHHFGMTMDADFYLPPHCTMNGEPNGEHIVYEFSGDDDMWVYVDGVLVLDIGGIHEPITGKIDFTTGDVWISNATRVGTSSIGGPVHTTLTELFQDAGKVWDPKAYSTHDVKAFYMERGGIYSNLELTIKLPTFVPVRFQKNISKNDKGILDGNEEYKFIAYTSETEQYDLPALRPAEYSAANAANLVKYKDNWYEIVYPTQVWNETKKRNDYVFTTGAGEANELMFLTGADKRLHHMEEVQTDTNLFQMKYSTDGGITYTDGTLSGDASTNPTSSSVSTGTFASNPDKVTVDNELKHIDIPVEKRWEETPTDPNFKVKVWLYEDDVKTDKFLELTQNGNWKGTFEDLPKYRKDLNETCGYAEIQYSVQEEINGYYPEYSEETIGGVLTKVIMNYSNPTSLDLLKYGGTGTTTATTVLDGAKFKLEKRREQGEDETWELVTNAKKESSNASGIYEVTDQPEFDNLLPGIYRLTETDAPAGYDLLTDFIYFNVTNKRVSLVKFDSAAKDYKPIADKTSADSWWLTDDTLQLLNIRNTPKVYPLKLTKVNSLNASELLAGAEFTFYSDPACTKIAKDASGTDIGVQTTGSAGENRGIITLQNLLPGTYYIKETKAPIGFTLITETLTVTIGNDGALSNVGIVSGDGVGTSVRIGKPEGIPENTEWMSSDGIIITNCPLYSLPSSGGAGIYMYMILGMMLMLGAAWINIKNKHRGVLKSIR